MDTRGHQFLAAFADIERCMSLELGRRGRFMDLAREYIQVQNLPVSYLNSLQTFASLRNAIDHNSHRGAYPIAEPIPEIVEEIRLLQEMIKSPPLALSVLGNLAVRTVSSNDPISTALEHVRRFDFSQLPVYDSGQYAGILTSNTISRWLAQQIANGGEHEDAPVSDVLAFREANDRALLVDHSVTAADAIDKLTHGGPERGPVNALIVTETASPKDVPMRVIVIYDLPRLSAALKFD